MRPSHARHPVLRRPSGRTVLVAAIAVLASLVAARTVARAEASVDALGETVEVFVALRRLAPGAIVTPVDVAVVRRPAHHVPEDAWTATADRDSLLGSLVREPIAAGEIVVGERIGSDDDLIPPQARAVAIPRLDAALPVRIGDRVDLVAATLDAGVRPFVVAEAAVVIDVTDESVVVTIERTRVAMVVEALTVGVVVLTLT